MILAFILGCITGTVCTLLVLWFGLVAHGAKEADEKLEEFSLHEHEKGEK